MRRQEAGTVKILSHGFNTSHSNKLLKDKPPFIDLSDFYLGPELVFSSVRSAVEPLHCNNAFTKNRESWELHCWCGLSKLPSNKQRGVVTIVHSSLLLLLFFASVSLDLNRDRFSSKSQTALTFFPLSFCFDG